MPMQIIYEGSLSKNIITENTDGVESKDEALSFSKVKYK